MRCGLTQGQLADMLGVAKRTQANYEAGTSDAPAWYLSAIAEKLGLDVLYVLTGSRRTSPVDSLTETEDLIVKQYRSINDFDQQAIRRFLSAMADDAGFVSS